MTLPEFDLHFAVLALEWIFITYFLIAHGGNFLLSFASLKSLRRQIRSENVNMLPRPSAGYEIPVSIIVPVSDASDDVGRFVHDLFNLDYPEFEVIVAVDGASEDTLSRLRRLFEMEIFPEAFWRQVQSKSVRGVYRSNRYPRLRLIDKGQGGLGDTINAGANAARYPIICIAHSECSLRRTSLREFAEYFMENRDIVALGTAPRFASSSSIGAGFLEQPRLDAPLHSLAHVSAQMRRELGARHGWSALNASIDTSDRFCVIRKAAFVEAGGCNPDAVNPVVELLGRIISRNAASYETCLVAHSGAPLVWRPTPIKLADVIHEIAQERRGLADAMKLNRDLLWRRWSGKAGRFTFPFLALTEVVGPTIELFAVLFFVSAFALDLVPAQHLVAFVICSAGFGLLVSWLTIALDAIVFRTYAGARSYIQLFIGAIVENFGYRQLRALCTAPASPKSASAPAAAEQRA